jgi:HEAT repeat protein
MRKLLTIWTGPVAPPLLLILFRVTVLLIPTGLLLLACLRWSHPNPHMLWAGIGFQVIVVGMSFLSRRAWRQPVGPSVVTLYLIALGWLWLAGDAGGDWYTHLARSILLVVPLVVFAWQTLTQSGAPALRRAQLLARRLADRKEWPSDLGACRSLPEVKALRAALHVDATPALVLVQHPRPEVRIAALAALEFRKEWQRGQAELVLRVAQHADEPIVRAAAISALGNVDDRVLIETLAEFLRDPSWEVRRSATEALMWDTEHRWPWIRIAARRALADPMYEKDGPLWHEGQILTPEAVHDLSAWVTEKGILAIRSAATLGAHFSRMLSERPERSLLESLKQQLINPHTPAVFRMELARLLHGCGELDPAVIEHLIDPSNPAPLRLIAIEALLSIKGADLIPGAGSGPTEALAALRDLARLPNREIALATADLIQRRLGVDLGLALGQPLPAIHTRQAAEVTRRVMAWAQADGVAVLSEE